MEDLPPDYPEMLSVTVYSPCQKAQTVEKASGGGSYEGTAGDFDMVTLAAVTVGAAQSWKITTQDYTPGSGCYGFRHFQRDQPGSDPRGTYSLLVGGSPDPDAGTAVVADAT